MRTFILLTSLLLAACGGQDGTCERQPKQPYDVAQWAVYSCSNDVAPVDDFECIDAQKFSGDDLLPTTWYCWRPGTGPITGYVSGK